MFYLYHHHDLGRLSELLAALLERRARAHPLETDTIIVPNQGVGRWLTMQLAASEGIAANFSMPLLARFIWEWLPRLLPNRPDSADYRRNRLRWHVYALLPTLADNNAAIARYLAGTPRDVPRLQLAERLAGVFDEYLIYRPRMLAGWEAGNRGDSATERWQAEVWRALTARLGPDHRARLLDRFIEQADAADFARLPPTIYCFGLNAVPPEYLRFLYTLGRSIDVHFLLANPSDTYWADVRGRPIGAVADEPDPNEGESRPADDHPLLASLGRGARDLLKLLYSDQLPAIQEPDLGEAFEYEPPAADTLLGRVRADVMRADISACQPELADGDASIQIHACHGPLREVRVLNDQLLDLLARDTSLEPRDVLVIMPNVDTYAPAIRSIFGGAPTERYLRFSFSDQSRGASHPIVRGFKTLLDMPLSRWRASEILEFASIPAIMRRFDLDEAALDDVTQWTQQAGVRWGRDRETRASFGANVTDRQTWRFGFDRLLLGLMQSDEEALIDGVAPFSRLEGNATAALGGLWLLCRRLQAWIGTAAEPASAAIWQDRLNAELDAFFLPDRHDTRECRALDEIRATIAVLGDARDCLDDEPLSWRAVRETIADELARPALRQPLLGGGITFCTMTALRSVPFRVICMLGMDEGAFPRQESDRGFNLLRARAQLGDYAVRDDDRLLFLESLMAARDVFYISYSGQDAASGDTLPPSPLVGQWLDFLRRYYFPNATPADFERRLITRQPMRPFDARLFDGFRPPSRLFTFDAAWQPASKAKTSRETGPAAFNDGTLAKAPDPAPVQLAALRRVFEHPARYFLRERLLVDFGSREQAVEDEEALKLENLAGWQVSDRMLRQALAAGDKSVETRPDALWRARGLLPPEPLDVKPFAEKAASINELLEIERSSPRRDGGDWLNIDLVIEDFRVIGRIGSLYASGPCLLRAGKLKMKYQLRAWIDYLAFAAAGHAGELRLAGLNDKDQAIERRMKLDPDAAREHLVDLLHLYRRAQREPLPFMPNLAEIYLDTAAKKTPAEALGKVNRKLTDRFHPCREAEDPWFACLLRADGSLGEDPADNDFCRLSEDICAPLRSQLEDADG
jgi:exodeoxyribonuclease V gamma subunit